MLAARLLVTLFRGANLPESEADEAYAAGILLAGGLRIFRNKSGYK